MPIFEGISSRLNASGENATLNSEHGVRNLRAIPFFSYSQLFEADARELLSVMIDVCRRGAYILQQDCRDFEKHLATYLDVSHVFGVANGTDAIHLGLRAARIKAGDEVILPSHTYVATAAAVRMSGATPVLAECGPDHMLDPADVKRRITSRTRAIMPVQLNGRTCNMSALADLADRYNLLICEDAAQALGSRFEGKCAGTFGAFGAFSFYPAKLLGCFGDGGGIVTNDPEMAKEIALLRDHGRDENGQIVAWGFNSRLDNLQAAVLDHKLKTFERDVARRRTIAATYQAGLGDVPELILPPAPNADPRHFDVYQNYEIEADRREELQVYLGRRDVQTIVQWAGSPLHRLKCLGFSVALPKTEAVFERCLLLPMNTMLSDDDVEYVISAIRKFYGR